MTISADLAAGGPPPPLDRELAGPLQDILDELPTPLTPDLIADRRRRTAAGSLSDEEILGDGAFTLDERRVPGPPGAPAVPVLVCRPTAQPGPHPVIYHVHGGGMVAGSARSEELRGDLGRAGELGLAVVAVEYRLAPEHPDPAPIEDCYAGLLWLSAHGADLGIDRERIVLSGNSAGGGLCAGLALLARDREGPAVLGQMLQCPMLDDRCDTPSAHQLVAGGLWDGRSNRAGWDALLGSRRGSADVSPYAAPARAEDLTGLPPTFVDVGAVEALRDEVLAWTAGLWRSGGDAELHVWAGAFHSFDQWVPGAAVSASAERARRDWLRRLLVR